MSGETVLTSASVKTLEPFLFENYSVGNYPIDILKNSTIGIDLTHYVSRLLTFKKEPLIEAIGGFPITLLNNMENDLKIFNELNIKPIFVIDGLSTFLNFQSDSSDGLNSAERIRSNKWDLVRKDYKVDTFRDFHTPLKCNLFNVLQFFQQHDIEYIVAPFQSSQQLYYMLEQNVIDTIYGSTDMLLFPLPLEKFIFCIEFQNREFKFLDKNYILNKLNLSEKQFAEIAMCVSNGYQAFNLNIFGTSNTDLTFQQLYDFVMTGGSIYNTLLSMPQLQDKFFKGLSALKFLPILNLEGSIEIMKLNETDQIPNDLHDFVGQKLSSEYYYLQSMGVTNYKIMETILHGTYLERLPLDCNPHKYYLTLVEDTELINKVLNLTTNFFNRYYQFKKYNLKQVLSNTQTRNLDLTSRLASPLYFQTRRYLYKENATTSFEFNHFCSNLETGLKISEGALTDEMKLSNNNELLGTSIIRSLAVLGLIQQDGSFTKFGLSFQKIIKTRETFLLLLFFHRFQSSLTKADFGKDKYELLSKILSIYRIQDLKPQNYTGKVSQPLLQFNDIFNKLNDQFNELLTANIFTILFNNELKTKFQYKRKDWYDLVAQNIFNKAFNSTLLGIMAESFFTSVANNNADTAVAKESLDAHWSNIFIEGVNAASVLQKGFNWFNDEVAPLVAELNQAGLIKQEIADLFKEASDLIKSI